MEALVATYFIDTSKTPREWLQGLHLALHHDPLTLPDWCREATFEKLGRTVRDGERGAKLLALLNEMRQDKAEGGLPVIVFPPRQARPDLAMVLGRSILALVGCKMFEGQSNHSAQLADNFASTDVNKLWTKNGNVLNSQLHESALAMVAASQLKLLRVGFKFAAKAAGCVKIKGQEIHATISPPMLTATFDGVTWTEEAERLLFVSGIAPHVDLLAENAAEDMQRHLRGCGPVVSALWAKALPDLRSAYNAAKSISESLSVADVLGIIDSVFPNTKVRNVLFRGCNVAIWRFGSFVFTPQAFVDFNAVGPKRAATSLVAQQRPEKKARKR